MRARLTVAEVVKLGSRKCGREINNRHINLYLEGVNRALGEIRETRHHVSVAYKKKFLGKEHFWNFSMRYIECGKMLRGLEH